MTYMATSLAVAGIVMITIGSVSAAVGIVLLFSGEGLVAIAADELQCLDVRMAVIMNKVMNNYDIAQQMRLMREILPALNAVGAVMRIVFCVLGVISALMGIMFGILGLLYTAVGNVLFDQRTAFFDQRTR